MTDVQVGKNPEAPPPPKTFHERVNVRLALCGATVALLAAIATPFTGVAERVVSSWTSAKDTKDIVTTLGQRMGEVEKAQTAKDKEVASLARDIQQTTRDLGRTTDDVVRLQAIQRELEGKVNRLVGIVEAPAPRRGR